MRNVGRKEMTKRESKLLLRWPEHRRRGKVLFVLVHGIPSLLGVLMGVLLYYAISQRVYWGGAAFMAIVVLVAGGIRGAFLWHKMESTYADSQEPQS